MGALLMPALEAASDALYRGSVPETTPEQRRADALGLLAERAFAAGFGESMADEEAGDTGDDSARGAPAERYMVVLQVDEAATLEDGTRVSAETSRRVACDASVIRTRGSEGGRREHAARTRVVPPRMRRALQLRDRGCRFPGCRSRFTDAHHVRHWVDGGPTSLDNLVLLCRVHHRLLHEGGFRLEANPKRPGRPYFVSPRGFRIPETPPPMRIGGRRIGGPSSRWEDEVPVALYLNALSAR